MILLLYHRHECTYPFNITTLLKHFINNLENSNALNVSLTQVKKYLIQVTVRLVMYLAQS